MRARGSCGVAVGSGVGGSAGVGTAVGGLIATGTAVAVGALAAVTRGVAAGVGTTVAGIAVLLTLARTGGRARPALSTARATTAPISPSSNRLLSSCQMVSRRRPPLDRNGRPHQSHSLDPAWFLPPHPAQTATGSSATGDTAGVLYYTVPPGSPH